MLLTSRSSVVGVLGLVALTLAACHRPAENVPAPFLGPTPEIITGPSSVQRPPPGKGLEVSTVFGAAYEHTGVGRQVLANFPVSVYGSRNGQSVTVDVVTDANGRYEAQGLEREFVSVGVRPQDAYLSPCSARYWLWDDRPIDVHVVSKRHLMAHGLPPSMPLFLDPSANGYVALLSGIVTERTATGEVPVVGASVEHLYGDGASGNPSGFTITDSKGFYTLCGYWDDFGQVVRARKQGYRTSIQSFGPSVRIDLQMDRD